MQIIKVIIGLIILLALYSLAGTSDQIDQLTAKERADVVARWEGR